MVKRLLLLPFLFLLGFSQFSMAAEFTASVDRTQITEQDSLTLTLRINEQVFRGQPDFQPLEQDFSIQGQQRSQQFRSINGKSESFTEWSIGLIPRRAGTLIIPALSFKGEESLPIKIEVSPPSAAVREQTEQDFFFNIEVTPKTSALVQSQLLYKEQLYYAADHSDANLSDFKVTDARVQPLGEIKQYMTVVNGRRFGVYERNFAIFPETTGELVIPGQQFRANVATAYDRWSRGQAINVVSKPIKINVAAIPANYPANAAWLPASQLTLSETFSKQPSQWQAGEAVTRTISIQAQGIPGNQLPIISLPEIDHLRYYPDQAVHNESLTAAGITGVAEQSVAIVASSGGEFTLPEIRLPWWNTQTNKLEYAVLPAHTVSVAGAVISNQKTAEPVANNSDAGQPVPLVSAPTNDWWGQKQWLAYLILALFCASLMLNLWLLLTRKKQPATVDSTQFTEKENAASLKQHWQAFNTACNNNAAADIRRTLLAWVNVGGLPSITLRANSLSELANQVSDPALAKALRELDSLLYSGSSHSNFNGKDFKALVGKAIKQPATIEKNDNLYPTI